MKFIGILTFLAGYALVYASLAAKGVFATQPWAGLFMDAYIPEDQILGGSPVDTNNPQGTFGPAPGQKGGGPKNVPRNRTPYNSGPFTKAELGG
jgi:hypothetical protein